MRLSDEEFRVGLGEVLTRAKLSRRGLSAAMGRDPGYVAALLDPSRPSRARPTPDDLLRAADATGMPFVELLELVWGIDPERLRDDLARRGVPGSTADRFGDLTEAERQDVADVAAFLASRRQARRVRRADSPA